MIKKEIPDEMRQYQEELVQKEIGVRKKILKDNEKLNALVEKVDNEIGKIKLKLEDEKDFMPIMEKVRYHRTVYKMENFLKKDYNDEVKKAMLEEKKERFQGLKGVEKEMYQKTFELDEHQREVDEINQQQIEDKYKGIKGPLTKALEKEKGKASNTFHQKNSGESKEFINLSLEHKGEIWHFEKRGFEESFSIESENGEKIATTRRKNVNQKFDSPSNAVVEYKDAETGAIIRNEQLPMDLEVSLDIIKQKANEYFKEVNLKNGKKLSPDFNSISKVEDHSKDDQTVSLPGKEEAPAPSYDPEAEYDSKVEVPEVTEPEAGYLSFQFPGYEEVPALKEDPEFDNEPVVEVPNTIETETSDPDVQFPGYEEIPAPSKEPEIDDSPGVKEPDSIEPKMSSLSDQFPGYEEEGQETPEWDGPFEVRPEVPEAELDSSDFPGGYDEYSSEYHSYLAEGEVNFNSPEEDMDMSDGPDMGGGGMD